jgi:hypothetical protein
MKVDRFSCVEVLKREKRSARLHGSHCYIVKSSLGTFLAFTFQDAVHLARQIFTIPGCWASINI